MEDRRQRQHRDILCSLQAVMMMTTTMIIIIGTARIVFAAKSMQRSSVHPSVCLSRSPAAAACGGFAAVG